MKYALLSLAGALGMGFSIIADSMGRSNDIAEFYAGAGFIVMTIGMLGIIIPALRDFFKKSDN